MSTAVVFIDGATVDDTATAPSEDTQPASNSDTTDETTRASTGVKRKRTDTKDPNAPKRPVTSYIFFNSEMRPKVKELHPEMGLSERSKLVGKMWADLKPEDRQCYIDMAEKDKERYIREYMAYQETDTYKEFMRKKFPALAKKPKVEQRKAETPPQQATKEKVSSGKTPLSCQQQFVPGSNIPIFSEEFLQHNREMETQLRKLRQSSANLEEENALLSRHVESMKLAVERVQNEVERQQSRNAKLHDHLMTLREVLATTFKDIPLPGTSETPTPENVDTYMSKLQLTIANEPEKHPKLVDKVGAIARQLATTLKQKLSEKSAAASQEDEQKDASNNKEDPGGASAEENKTS